MVSCFANAGMILLSADQVLFNLLFVWDLMLNFILCWCAFYKLPVVGSFSVCVGAFVEAYFHISVIM